jgi:hypothetical protein
MLAFLNGKASTFEIGRVAPHLKRAFLGSRESPGAAMSIHDSI